MWAAPQLVGDLHGLKHIRGTPGPHHEASATRRITFCPFDGDKLFPLIRIPSPPGRQIDRVLQAGGHPSGHFGAHHARDGDAQQLLHRGQTFRLWRHVARLRNAIPSQRGGGVRHAGGGVSYYFNSSSRDL